MFLEYLYELTKSVFNNKLVIFLKMYAGVQRFSKHINFITFFLLLYISYFTQIRLFYN